MHNYIVIHLRIYHIVILIILHVFEQYIVSVLILFII